MPRKQFACGKNVWHPETPRCSRWIERCGCMAGNLGRSQRVHKRSPSSACSPASRKSHCQRRSRMSIAGSATPVLWPAAISGSRNGGRRANTHGCRRWRRNLLGRADEVIDGRLLGDSRCPTPSSATPSAPPIGRYGGALAKMRTDDLAAIPIKALIDAQPKRRLVAARRGVFRLRQPGRRGQPQRRAHGAAARRPAGCSSGRHRQPAVCVGTERGGRCRARDPVRRDGVRHCRRRRDHDARAVRHGQSRRGVPRSAELTTPPSAGASSIR